MTRRGSIHPRALSLIAALSLLALLPSAARADGGDGGAANFGIVPGGAGGSGFSGTAGSGGTDNGPNPSGGGGGGSAGGGLGGVGGGFGGGGGGTVATPNGGNAGISEAGGGGGFGGLNGNGAGAATITNGAPLAGGNGGNGGNGLDGGGGGGGGAGGYGVIVTGAGASSNSSTITGGAGGNGGNGGGGVGSFGGSGGDGGVGIQFTASGATFTNSGTISAGNGGILGISFAIGNPGAGGAGIVGAGLTVINSGGITGGLGGDGVTRASAIIFTGGTNVLELQAGSTITGNVVAFSAADTLALGGTTSASFDVSQISGAAQYQGFGLFNKSGSSTWTLTGTNAAVLPWTIDAGTLAVNGTIANSTMTVNSGGTLAGTGTVGGVTVNSGGSFAPGSGAAGSAMSVSGNLAFQSGALYLVQVSPSSASSANVSGTATLTGASVQTVFAPGSYVTRQYTILQATGGLGGTTFTGVSGNVPAGFSESLSYTSTEVLLNLTATLGALPGAGLAPNQQNVAGALNNFFNNGGTLPPNFVTVFGLTGGNLATALTQLSGEAATGAQQGAFQMMGQFLGLMLDPFLDGRGGVGGGQASGFAPERAALPEHIALAYAKAMKAPAYQAPPAFAQRWSVWASGFGGANNTNGDPNLGSHDLTARVAGAAAGVDYHLTRDAVVGFALAGGGTRWDLAQGLGGGKSDAFQGGVYAALRSGPAYVAASLAGANHWMSTDRLAAFGDHLTASFHAQSFGGRIESGYRFVTPVVGITPYGALQAQSFRTPSYSETDVGGGGFGLAYNGRTASNVRSELGARFDRAVLVNPDAVLTLRGRAAWAHDWVSDPTLNAVFQALPGASFIVNGASPAKDSALASAGAELRFANGIALLGKFDGEFASRSHTYAGTGTLRVTW